MAVKRRRAAAVVDVGGVKVGGDYPIVVQSMTNTDTADSASTVNQAMALARAGSELVRVTVNTEEAAAAVPRIVDWLDKFGVPVPIIGDFHYNGHILLKKYPECARALAKYRINPGNVNIGKKHDDNFRTMIEVAIEYGKPVRIGVNWGSLDQALLTRMMDENSRLPEPKDARDVTLDAMVASAIESARAAERYGLPRDQHHPQRQSQRRAGPDRRLSRAGGALRLSAAPRADRGRHGQPRASSPPRRRWPSLLQEGIGDTIRASLTPLPNGDRTEEVIVSQQILQSLGIRSFTPQVTACPGCGRTTSTFFQEMADQIQTYLREQMPVWKAKHPGVGEHERGGDGLRRERSRRIQARQYRHFPARHVRGAQGAGLRGRASARHAERRPHRRRVHRNSGRLRSHAVLTRYGRRACPGQTSSPNAT